ncbi:MAG: hypothetical protein KAR32_07985, partial [Candidatus Omnitrophica bacterium]|nr:hypothetical protein [Candidatus Omnitrophota bacterium]
MAVVIMFLLCHVIRRVKHFFRFFSSHTQAGEPLPEIYKSGFKCIFPVKKQPILKQFAAMLDDFGLNHINDI